MTLDQYNSGGDLDKWLDCEIQHVHAIDLSPAEIEEARMRLDEVGRAVQNAHPSVCLSPAAVASNSFTHCLSALPPFTIHNFQKLSRRGILNDPVTFECRDGTSRGMEDGIEGAGEIYQTTQTHRQRTLIC